jgi:hypothetical protein
MSAKGLEQRLSEFRELGYTIFEDAYDAGQMQAWKDRYDDLVLRNTPPDAPEPRLRVTSVLEQEPWLMLPAVNNQQVLDFAERVMGPFVQLDNLTFMAFPSEPRQQAEGTVSFWHRDRWGWMPDGPQYIRPTACNAICYLQDLTDEYGPLRVVEGSHRRAVTIESESHRTRPHPEETVLRVKAGSVVFTHCSLLHTGTPNISGKPRYFFSTYYNRVGLPTRDNHKGPSVQKIVEMARARNDRRLMRLFGVDDAIEARANAMFLKPVEEMWDRWIAEDRAALLP